MKAAPSDAEAVSALVNLGYRAPDAERAVRAAIAAGARVLADVIGGRSAQISLDGLTLARYR